MLESFVTSLLNQIITINIKMSYTFYNDDALWRAKWLPI